MRSARMAATVADAPVRVVMHGTPCIIATRRTVRSSKNESRPSGVLTMSAILPVDDLIGDVRPAFVDLVDDLDLQAVGAQVGGRAARGDERESQLGQIARDRQHGRLVVVVDADERAARVGQALPDRQAAPSRTRRRSSSAPPITSPVDFISGPRIVSTPGNRTNGNTGLLTKTPATSRSFDQAEVGQRAPAITRAATFASGMPVAFDRYGTVRDARGFTSST